jgi:hypothetical protein
VIEPSQITTGSDDGQIDTSRSVLLNGNDASSTWEINIAPVASREFAGVHRFTLRRDFNCDYTFTNSQGTSNTSALSFVVERITSSAYPGKACFTLFIFDSSDANGNSFLNCGFLPKAGYGRDTLQAVFVYPGFPGGAFPMIRK